MDQAGAMQLAHKIFMLMNNWTDLFNKVARECSYVTRYGKPQKGLFSYNGHVLTVKIQSNFLLFLHIKVFIIGFFSFIKCTVSGQFEAIYIENQQYVWN